jgi:Putative metal-binding motif
MTSLKKSVMRFIPAGARRPDVAQRRYAAFLLCLFVVYRSGHAHAHAGGEAAEGCAGCHNGGQTPTVSITPSLTTINPGQTITLTISISQTNGPVAGFFLENSTGVGVLSIVDSGTKLLGAGVTHTAPRTGSGGFTTFKVGWTAPGQPGGVDFSVWANSANGDGTPRGDGEGQGFFSTAFGCAGSKYYHDYDGDSYGAIASGYTINCSAPQYFTEKVGDCNDNDPVMFPGNPEVCDGKDNNCNGQIDEGLPIITYCTDADGDGHGVLGEGTSTGCKPPKGFGLCDGDCNDNDPTIYPGAPELCDGKDNNCNGQVDEGARAECGLGWCARYAEGCMSTACTPGAPRAEICNDFDDDCDGVVDNGTNLELCGKPGLACRAGVCVVDPNAASEAPMPTPQGGSGSGGAPASTGSSGTPGNSAPSSEVVASQEPAPETTPPGGCALQVGGTHAPFAYRGMLLALTALLARRRRRLGNSQRLAPR